MLQSSRETEAHQGRRNNGMAEHIADMTSPEKKNGVMICDEDQGKKKAEPNISYIPLFLLVFFRWCVSKNRT